MRYIFSTRNRNISPDWAIEAPSNHGFADPVTFEQAVLFYREIANLQDVRVEYISSIGMVSDVSNQVMLAVDDEDEAARIEAELERRHEAQETHGWEQV